MPCNFLFFLPTNRERYVCQIIVSWPQGLKNPNRISNHMGCFLDIMSTFWTLREQNIPRMGCKKCDIQIKKCSFFLVNGKPNFNLIFSTKQPQ